MFAYDCVSSNKEIEFPIISINILRITNNINTPRLIFMHVTKMLRTSFIHEGTIPSVTIWSFYLIIKFFLRNRIGYNVNVSKWGCLAALHIYVCHWTSSIHSVLNADQLYILLPPSVPAYRCTNFRDFGGDHLLRYWTHKRPKSCKCHTALAFFCLYFIMVSSIVSCSFTGLIVNFHKGVCPKKKKKTLLCVQLWWKVAHKCKIANKMG